MCLSFWVNSVQIRFIVQRCFIRQMQISAASITFLHIMDVYDGLMMYVCVCILEMDRPNQANQKAN